MKADAPRASYRSELALLATGAAGLLLLALLPCYVGLYQTQLLTYGLIAAIAALGFNLLLGYTGLLSFGHSAFFGLGAYTIALLLRYGDIHAMEAYMVLGLPMVALASVLFGYISVRHTRIFFGILTLSLSQVLYSLALKFFWVTGGTDGLRVARPSLLFGLFEFTGGGAFQRFINAYYYYVLAIFAICVVLMWIIVHSPFGKTLQAIRDNETRAAFLGLRIRRFRLIAFTLSGTFTGLAGILWAPLNGLATPDVLYWPFSGEIVFTALLGGFRNFTGPIVGGIVFTYLKTYAVASTPYWQLLLGQILVALVIILPTGIVGALANPKATWRSLVNARPDTLLRSAGVLLMMVAFNWWLILYGRGSDLRGAAECLLYTAAQCMPSAAPKWMWSGMGVLALGLMLQIRSLRIAVGVPMKSGAPAE
jgi:branched-chain amino acid transport system permease protein